MDVSLGKWTDVDIAGHVCQTFEPATPSPHGFTVIYLHDRRQRLLSEQTGFTQVLARRGLRIVCPLSGASWWTDRLWPPFDPSISAERYVVDHVVAWIDANWQVRPPGIALLGASMGGQGALRIAFKHAARFPTVAALSPAIDYHFLMDEGDETLFDLYPDQETARQDTAILHIHPLNWPRNIWFACDPADRRWHEGADRLRMKLAALGIPFECDLETSVASTSGAGSHGFDYYNRVAESAVAFIVARLESERLRVV